MITIGGKEITAAYVGKLALDLDTGKATSRGTDRTHGTVAVKLINE